MHRKLSVLAAKTSKKKVEIIRFLLDEALKDVEE
jgi:predicted DNA-binding protein